MLIKIDIQFRKIALLQAKFLDLISLVLKTIWYTFNSHLSQQTDGVAMGVLASSTTAEMYMQNHNQTAISTKLHPKKLYEQFFDEVYFIIKLNHWKNFYHNIKIIHENIKFTMEN